MSFPCLYITKTGILHWLSSVYWAINQDTDAIWVEMAMGNAHI